MSRRLMKLCIAAALVAAALAGASSASANWTTNGSATGTPFSLAAAGGIQFKYNTTGAASLVYSCSSSSMAGVLNGPSLSSGTGIAQLTPSYAGCSAAGRFYATKCSLASLNAVAYNPATSLTSSVLANITCNVTWGGSCGNSTTVTGGITITGSVTTTYGNTTQQLTINTAGQALSATWTSSACYGGSQPASVQLTNSTGTAPIYTVSSAFKPQITN
ncbi:MAG: hypothetical protein JWR63_888 [Conexibacter sp.]|nr:hypothetical protein [Conexibacter sp.]